MEEIAELFANDYNIPPPAQENSAEVNRFLGAFAIEMENKDGRMEIQTPEYKRNELEKFHRICNFARQLNEREEQAPNQPPHWFQSWLNDPNAMTAKVDRLEGRLDRLEMKFDRLEMNFSRSQNIQRRSMGCSANIIPFLHGDQPDDDLPGITSVEDIDRLTRDQCTRYLDGYEIPYNYNETIRLKERLRDAVGLISPYDITFCFSGFQ
ncbi:DUF1773 family protein [Schizosaccharomyces osmophilus]|uniref:DUF1773 family protein n=1 Tax=Schizosaccharomyces osmophilus TaxID=2545709 RepID=A0AAE9WKX8_9SCHI|nr:DUF1773 family protein [Schizosaccharomyces osmophilus]WBW75593.1 DUF1773 family protein [Schizosaccharomyces osmophilus]